MTAAHARSHRILILNASLAGAEGNTAVALARLRRHLARRAQTDVCVLATMPHAEARRMMEEADGVVIGTGTHWDSWSSVLQRFLEEATETEGTKLWLGKPAACVVTEHSVGGKGVLSRLQGVLTTLGCSLPPMGGIVLSKVAQIAAQQRCLAKEAKHAKAETEDFWCADDLKIVAHNLTEAVNGTQRWKAWPVDRMDFSARWML
jgi:multimeric flavodoxin WrbA